MAWTSPRTWTPGEIVTASVMNTHVRDDLNSLYSAISDYTLVRRVATQSPTNGAQTPISFDTETADDLGIWVSGTPTRFTTVGSGYRYWIFVNVWPSSASGTGATQVLVLRYNSSSVLQETIIKSDTGMNSGHSAAGLFIAAAAGDYFTVEFTGSATGSAHTVTASVAVRRGNVV